MKKRSKPRSPIQEIDDQISDLWRLIEDLMKEVDKKTDHMNRLREHKQTPLMVSDTPITAWQCIAQQYIAIGNLKDVRHRLVVADAREAERKKTRKPVRNG